MTSKAIMDIALKKKGMFSWELNLGCLHYSLACYQLSYWGHDRVLFSKIYLLIVKKLVDKLVYYTGTLECQHLIFWPWRFMPGVYSISCECGKVYIGQIGPIQTRVKNTTDTCLYHSKKSAVAEHSVNLHHHTQLQNTSILAKKSRCLGCTLTEVIGRLVMMG
jgi:hypothetical protein